MTVATRKSITRKEEFLKWLGQVRKQGFVIDVEMALDGITGVAAPIFDHTGKVIAGVGVGFISSSVSAKELKGIVKEVTKTAMTISKEMGYSGEGGQYSFSKMKNVFQGFDSNGFLFENTKSCVIISLRSYISLDEQYMINHFKRINKVKAWFDNQYICRSPIGLIK